MFGGILRKLNPIARWRQSRSMAAAGVPGFVPRVDDRYILSFPKSGNTWARFLVGHCLLGREMDFPTIVRTIPDIYVNQDPPGNPVLPCRLLKSHVRREHLPVHDAVVYLVRDPRSVSVSFYHFALRQRYLDESLTFAAFLPRWLDGEWSPCGPWNEHVLAWLGAAGRDERIAWFRYEDMLVDARPILRGMLAHLGIAGDEALVDRAVRASAFAAMQRKERENQEDPQARRPGIRFDIPFIRKGSADEWRSFFDEELEARLCDRWAAGMRLAGYT